MSNTCRAHHNLPFAKGATLELSKLSVLPDDREPFEVRLVTKERRADDRQGEGGYSGDRSWWVAETACIGST
jgi:hypothetical protein